MTEIDTTVSAITSDTTPLFFHLAPGNPCVWRGCICEIEAILSLDTVRICNRATGEKEVVKVTDLIGVPTQKAGESERIADNIVKEALKLAGVRERLLRPFVISGTRISMREMAELTQTLNLQPTRIRQLLRTLRDDHRPKAIVCKKRGVKSGTLKLTGAVELIVRKVIKDAVEAKKPIRLNALYDNLKIACANAKRKLPHIDTLAARIPIYGRQLAYRGRLGPKRAREAVRGKGGIIQTSHALAVVEIDHSPLNVIVVDSVHRKHIGRAYLTLVVDRHTRVVLGFCVSLEAPSRLTVALGLTHAILSKDLWLASLGVTDFTWPMWGVMKKILTDTASEFTSDSFEAGCGAWGIVPQLREEPEDGAIVERVFGTLHIVCERIPGATGPNPRFRDGYDATKDAVMTLRELEIYLARHICCRYHKDFHSGIEMTPEMAWEQAHTTCDGLHLPPIVTDRRKLLLDFLPRVQRLVTPIGIHFNGDRYWSPALRPLVGTKKPVWVRYDPRGMGKVYAQMGDTYIDVLLADPRQGNLPLWEIKAVRRLKKVLAKVRRTPESELVTLQKQAELIQSAERATKDARRAERLRQSQEGNANDFPSLPQHVAKKANHSPLDYTTPTAVAPLEADNE